MLEIVMAFAVTMIIFSTITTGIVEAILRRLGRRERNLENTIRSLYQSVIVPWYAKARERNVRSAFATNTSISGRCVIIDDVMTSGATVRAVTLALHFALEPFGS